MWKLSFIVIGLLILVGSFQTDFMKEEWKDVCVVRKHEDTHTYKGRVYFDHYLILKDKKERTFQRDVSVKLFTEKNVGDCFRFMLREANISNNSEDHFKYSFLPMLLGSLFLSIGIAFSLFPSSMFKN